jgi:hypothetical protein
MQSYVFFLFCFIELKILFFTAGLVFNEKKKECDYQADSTEGAKGSLCLQPRSFLRSKPKSEQASILFEGVDATGQFPYESFLLSFIENSNFYLEHVSIVLIKIKKTCFPISIGVISITYVSEVEIIYSYVHRVQYSMIHNKVVWIDMMELIVMVHVLIINQR